jgi:predicted ATPase/DNA-binding SARP family transcriptional activator
MSDQLGPELGPELRLELLGGFRVACGVVAVDERQWRLRKARRLVALLALSPEHSLHREVAIEALWPDIAPAAASNNLRQALFVARRALDSCGDDGAKRLALTNDTLTLTTDGLRVDVEDFEAAAAAAERNPGLASHQLAIERYGGELLPEDRFEEWVSARRVALAERYVNLLVELGRQLGEAGEEAEAVTLLQRALVEEPLHERGHRCLMRIYALTGRRQRALAQFQVLREALRHAYEDEPEEDTRHLYREILTRRLGGASGPFGEAGPSSRAPRSPLPVQLTSFVGRDRERREVLGLARRHRLLTLTGPGGCGKTRLALEVAEALSPEMPEGSWFVELAGLSDGNLVAHAVAASLGVESRSTRALEDALAAHVGRREMLVVLDTCEHLATACARLGEDLLRRCPGLRLLATSREPLHASGEVDWRVPSMAPSEAATLFAERARSVTSRFAVSDENEEAIAEICDRVDRIPLAIELAAARVAVLSPAQIAERLQHSLNVLAARHATGLTRQQTLTATLDWSHDLLSGDERALLRRLAVFAAGFELDAAESICGGDLDILGALVEKSLLVVEEQDGIARYRLLDTVRHYARARLAEAGETAAYERRHRHHYLQLAEQLEPEMDGPAARRRLALEADELRRALRTALSAEPQTALALVAALWRYWHDRGDRLEGARWIDEALRTPEADPALLARVLHGRSVLALRMSDYRRARYAAERAVAHLRELGDQRLLADELHHVGTMTWVFADFDGAERWCRESRAVALAAGEPAAEASVLHTLGVLAGSRESHQAGRDLIAQSIERLRLLPEEQRPLLLPVAAGYGRLPCGSDRPPRRFLEQTFVTARQVGPAAAIAYSLSDLAILTRDLDDLGTARELLEESLAAFRGLGDELGAAQALALLGNLSAFEGDHGPARERHEESLAVRESLHDARGIGLSLIALALGAWQAGDTEQARTFGERAIALFDRTDDGPGRAATVLLLSYVAFDEGRLDDAAQLAERALALWRLFIPSSPWCAACLVELAELDIARGESHRAPRRLHQAEKIFAAMGDQAAIEYCRRGQRKPANGALTPQ